MEETSTFLSIQNLATLLIGLGIAVFLYLQVRRSQAKRGEKPGEVKATGPGILHQSTTTAAAGTTPEPVPQTDRLTR